MKKRLLCLFILCVILLCGFGVSATPPLDVDAEASLTLLYQKEGVGFSDLHIRIYRVAEPFPDGPYGLVAPFSGFPVNVNGVSSQEQWTQIATTLESYVVAEGIAPTAEQTTDGEGAVSFEALQIGLYLVQEVVADTKEGIYVFNRFMVYLPTPLANNSYDYTVEAKPKCISYTPKTHYSVTKLWQDGGSEELRPSQVTVEIYRDGELHETVILSTENNWSHSWYVSAEAHYSWSVVERAVAKSYNVTLVENGSAFSIINTAPGDPGEPPVTGDSDSVLPWILLMGFGGMVLMLVSSRGRRVA